MSNSIEIAKYFVSKNRDLTDIQIQKLVYYSYAWYMVLNKGSKLFEEQPEAWVHGPVFRNLYNEMKYYRKRFFEEEISSKLEFSITHFLDMIYEIYGQYSGYELEKLTHSEAPWRKARAGIADYEYSGNKILDEDIIKYYSAEG